MNQIRELTLTEIDEVGGGPIPVLVVVAVAVAAAGAAGVAGYCANRQSNAGGSASSEEGSGSCNCGEN